MIRIFRNYNKKEKKSVFISVFAIANQFNQRPKNTTINKENINYIFNSNYDDYQKKNADDADLLRQRHR
ncbi:hypothetical protein OA93_10005 [Flavobacterium sp. KMS]|jgi:hypothetical protein|nr:hypothetical protein OA93_10005 [Flavobacterium sp. KMS]KIA98759.1 hypothetical protein OA88_20445 [Flavobacterium sp. JRM]